MQLISEKVLSEMRYTPQTNIDTYCSQNVVIFRPTLTLEKKTVFNNYYHFIIPLSQQMPIRVEKKEFLTIKKNIFCINPFQEVQSFFCSKVEPYWAIFVNRGFLEETLGTILDKEKIVFPNNNNRVSPDLLGLIDRFNQEARNGQPGIDLVMQCLSTEMIVFILRHFQNNPYKGRGGHSSRNKGIDMVIEYMQTYYYEDMSLQEIASIANFSPYHFIRVFKARTGKTPFEYLMDIRIEKSKELLEGRELNITEVGYECGFSDLNHFYIMFKKKTSISPTEYRRTVR